MGFSEAFQKTKTIGSDNHSLSIKVSLLGMLAMECLFFIAVYYFLTSDQPFNFNNNYHLIAFAASWTVFFNFSILFSFGNRFIQTRIAGDAEYITDEDWQSAFVLGVLMTVLCVFPISLYFFVLDDFMFQIRQWMPLIFMVLLLSYLFRQAGKQLVQRPGLISRLVYLVFVIIFLIAVVEILTGMIPTSIRSGQGDVMLPL